MSRLIDEIVDIDNQVVDATTAKDFACPAGARGFWISCKTADIWIWPDGSTTAAASDGLLITAGQPPVFMPFAKDISAFGAAASCPTSVAWVR